MKSTNMPILSWRSSWSPRKQAPASDMSTGDIEARVAADQVERAVDQYRYAAEGDRL